MFGKSFCFGKRDQIGVIDRKNMRKNAQKAEMQKAESENI